MTNVNPALILFALLLITVVLTYAGAASYLEGQRQQQAALRQGAPQREVGPVASRARSLVEKWGRTTRPGRALTRRFAAAGLTVRLADVLLIVLGVMTVLATFGWWLFGPLAALVAVVFVIQVGVATLRWLTDRRLEKFVAQLPQLARLLANGAAAGLSIRRSISTASTELAEPARTELIGVSDALTVGMPLERALAKLDERLPSRELAVLVNTLIIQVRSGGGVVTALSRMSQTLDARKKLRGEMRSALAGTVYVAYLLPVIGLAGVVLVTGGDRAVIREYFTDPIGQIALIASLLLGGVGMLLIRRAVRQALRA